MRKTYITSMPNRIGAFLKASKCFSELGINITRVSYNKAVDSHTLFIDAEGTQEQLEKASAELEKIGYLQSNVNKSSIVLIEFWKTFFSKFYFLFTITHIVFRALCILP